MQDRISMLLSSRQLFKNRERERKKTGFESEKRVEAQKRTLDGWQDAFVEIRFF